MDVQLAEDGPCSRTLTIKITPERIRDHLDDAYREASRQVKIKGFRAGHVPRKVLEKRFGDAIRVEAKDSLVSRMFNEAIRAHDLHIVGRPRVEGLDDKPLSESEPIEFRVKFDIRPVIEIGDTKGIEVERRPTDVTDEDIDAALRQIADQKKTLDTVDGAVENGDFVRADMTFADGDGNTILERKGSQLSTAIPIAGTDPQTFSAQLVGKQRGEECRLEIEYPANFEKESVRGQRGSVVLHIHDVLRVQAPAIDDELAKELDHESLEALRTDLAERIAVEKVRAEKVRQEESILEILLNEQPFELPATLVEDQASHQLQLYAQRLKQQGMEDGAVEGKVEESRQEALEDARRRIRMFFLLDAIARREKLFVTDADVDVELRNIAAHHGLPVDDVRQHYEQHKLMDDLRVGIMERKVRDHLRGNAKFTDKT